MGKVMAGVMCGALAAGALVIASPDPGSAAGGGGRRPALTGPAARPSSSTEVDCRRALGRGPVEQLHQGMSAA